MFFLDDVATRLVDFCTPLEPVMFVVRSLIALLQWGVPILLVVFGMLDLGKAVMAGKEDEMKKAQGTLIKRVIYAVAVYLVVAIVSLVMSLVSSAPAESDQKYNWMNCLYPEKANSSSNNNNNGTDRKFCAC